MSMSTCRECGAAVSTEAPICPSCGTRSPSTERLTRQSNRRGNGIAVVLVLAIAAAGIGAMVWTQRADKKAGTEECRKLAQIEFAGDTARAEIRGEQAPSGPDYSDC